MILQRYKTQTTKATGKLPDAIPMIVNFYSEIHYIFKETFS